MAGNAPTVGEVVGRHVRRYREGLDWRQEDLADETSKLGHPMNRVTISNIERGGTRARNISLVDTLVLAAALNVPPPMLFLPLGLEDLVTITPKTVIHPHIALDWVVGEGPLAYTNRRARDVTTWHEHSTPMWLFQELRKLQAAVESAQARLLAEEGEDRVALARERCDGALRQLDQHLTYMERADLRTPKMPPEWTDRMQELRAEGGN
jgi:transcriptional regulator with XRE-family HTH domain